MEEQIQDFDQDPLEVQQFVPSPQKKRYVALKTKFCNKHECIWRSLDCTQKSRFIRYKFQGLDSYVSYIKVCARDRSIIR